MLYSRQLQPIPYRIHHEKMKTIDLVVHVPLGDLNAHVYMHKAIPFHTVQDIIPISYHRSDSLKKREQ